MSASIYSDKLVVPDEKLLANDLGDTKSYLDKIAAFIEHEYGDLKTEWKYYGTSSGWILKMFVKKRNVLFLIPCHGHFLTVFTFGDKAVSMLLESDVSDDIKVDVMKSKKCAEGRSIRKEVIHDADLENVIKMIRIKLT
jgi:hypothetical protein